MEYLETLEAFLWEYIGVYALLIVGIFFSFRARGFQFKVLRHLPSTLKMMSEASNSNAPGISPIKVLWASAGGMIGVGNIVGVITALQIGGPGSLFWLWVCVLIGSVIKYSEIFLGMKFRQKNGDKGYEGSVMHAFPKAFPAPLAKILAVVAGLFLCFYGIEIYQFNVLSNTVAKAISIEHKDWVVAILLFFTFYIGLGGIKRLSNLCAFLMPILMVVYVGICLWIILSNFSRLPGLMLESLKSAFVGYAPLGGFAGATVLVAIHQGFVRAVYSSDIAIGMDSILHSESSITNPGKQACISVIATLIDASICTLSFFVVLISGYWCAEGGLPASECVMKAFEKYIPHSPVIIGLVIVLAGFTTIQTYFTIGLKSAKFLQKKWGQTIYLLVAIVFFWVFSHYEETMVLKLMSIASLFLMLINVSCMFLLRKSICFNFKKDK